MKPEPSPAEGFTARDVVILAIVVVAGALVFYALPALGVCLVGCSLTPSPLRH